MATRVFAMHKVLCCDLRVAWHVARRAWYATRYALPDEDEPADRRGASAHEQARQGRRVFSGHAVAEAEALRALEGAAVDPEAPDNGEGLERQRQPPVPRWCARSRVQAARPSERTGVERAPLAMLTDLGDRYEADVHRQVVNGVRPVLRALPPQLADRFDDDPANCL